MLLVLLGDVLDVTVPDRIRPERVLFGNDGDSELVTSGGAFPLSRFARLGL